MIVAWRPSATWLTRSIFIRPTAKAGLSKHESIIFSPCRETVAHEHNKPTVVSMPNVVVELLPVRRNDCWGRVRQRF